MKPDKVVNLSLVSSGGGEKKNPNDPMEEFYLLGYAPLEKWMVGAEEVGERFRILHYAQLMIYLPIRCPLAPTLDSRWVQGGQVPAALIDFRPG